MAAVHFRKNAYMYCRMQISRAGFMAGAFDSVCCASI